MRVCLLPLTVVFLLFTCLRNLTAADAAAPVAKLKITIGKDTTYITEPLRPDGYPDYVAAINEIYSRGVTPENNAAVPLMQAFGPKIIPEKIRAETLKRLGIDLPENGDYLVSKKEMISRWRKGELAGNTAPTDDKLDAQFDDATERPWSDEEFPIVAQWLAINEAPLEIAIQGIQRPKYYTPYLCESEEFPPVITLLLPITQECREIAQMLAARAMRRVKAGDIEAGRRDLMSCHQLARHIARGACLVDCLVGYKIETNAIQGDGALAHYGNLSANRAREMQAEVKLLPPLSDITDKINITERFMLLDAVAHVARAGRYAAFLKVVQLITTLSSSKDDKPVKPNQDDMALDAVDWNIPLQKGNQWFDRLVKCGRISDPREQSKALHLFDEDLRAAVKEVQKEYHPFGLMFFFTNSPSKEKSGQVIGNLFSGLFVMSLPSAFVAHQRMELLAQMDETTFALAAYRAEHGNYPDKLESLEPKYLVKIPEDTFSTETERPIHYRQEGKAYVLWSVGMNGIDDNARSYGDDPPGDDWVLRPIPLEKKSADPPR